MTTTLDTLRPAQREILAYTGGRLAISAVPGAGKTFILTRLASKLIEEGLAKPSEILILTYMRSAAGTFKRRIANLLSERNQTSYGLTSSTIHAFCLSIIKRYHERFGNPEDGSDDLTILSEAEQEMYLLPHLDVYLRDPIARADWEKRYARGGQDADPRRRSIITALRAISAAKNFRLTPDEVEDLLYATHPEICHLYRSYLMELKQRRAVDYDDQIQQAIALLEKSTELRSWYQKRFRYVMEDEAQDSTPAQNRLIHLLTAPELGGSGNLVRVGDSNQAITTSFTFNDPRFFRAFCAECALEGRHVTMNESSRSGQPIIERANTLVGIAQGHPDAEIREAFDRVPISCATAGKANPDPATCSVRWRSYGSKDEERFGVLTDIRNYLSANPEARVAILCATNNMGQDYLAAAKLMGIPVHEPAEDKTAGAAVVNVLKRTLSFLSLPSNRQAESFMELLEALCAARQEPLQDLKAMRAHLKSPGAIDDLIYPPTSFAPARPAHLAMADYAAAVLLGRRLKRLLSARHLPPNELLPTIARELLSASSAQVLASKAAMIARNFQGHWPYQPTAEGDDWIDREDPLSQLQHALDELATTTEKRSMAPGPQELVPPQPGEIEILTLHKSKGAEYEAVWIPNLGYYYGDKTWFPWTMEEVEIWDRDAFLAEQFISHAHVDPRPPIEKLEAAAKQVAISEKLRLLYVGITRAEQHLCLSAYGFKPERIAPWHLRELAKGVGG